MSSLISGIFCATFLALDGIAFFVAGYATFVDLAKLISTFAAGYATFVDLAKLIAIFVAA